MQAYNYYEEIDYSYLPCPKNEEIEEPYKYRYTSEKQALIEILNQLFDNPDDLDKNQLHGDLMFLCIQNGINIREYDDVNMLSIDHYKEKYKYEKRS